ncbi:MAG: NAD(P)/FAD-dependent oxidoreductase [Firmicutes bacterium]|jgi:electron-transferring-flavoprotein dehydrogenase|nr:NAD(P)/FAD-dependent oxidoreductase [Bacillota bacterium]
MEKSYDVIVVGAGTAGTYFAKLMAARGYKVLVAEKAAKENLGQRLDIFHIDEELFEEFDVPVPSATDEDYVGVFKYAISKSAFDQYPKRTDYPFVVMHLPLFLARLARWAEGFGVEYAYETEFVDFVYSRGRIEGAKLRQGGNIHEVSSRLVADASGISSEVRRKLGDGYGVENFEIGPDSKFYVILRYVKLKNPETDRVDITTNWPFYKTWIAPQHDPDGAIIGVGANFSFEYAEEIYQKFTARVELPPHELQYFEKGTTPYRRPPYSFVADGFVVLGDSACLTKPYSGEGITAAWVLCKIAAEEFSNAMRDGRYPDTGSVWNTNVRYQRGQGAKFAYIMATLIGAVNGTAEENHYQFKKGIVFNEKDMTDMNRDFGVNLGIGSIISLVLKIIGGVLTRNISLHTLKELIRAVLVADKLQKHYEKFPADISAYETWKRKAEALWASAGSMADTAKH